MNNDIRRRLLDIYSDLGHYTHLNYVQTNNTIQRLEAGIREIIRLPTDNNTSTNNASTNNASTNSNIPTNNETRSTNNLSGTPLFDYIYPIGTPLSSRLPSGLLQHTTVQPNRTQPSLTNPSTRRQPTRNQTNRTQPRISYNSRPSSSQSQNVTDLFTAMFSGVFNTDQLTPVIIRPTRTQIENATEIITTEENMINNTCPILQTPFQDTDIIVRIKHCGHCFIQEGLISWFNQSVLCPVCRYDIREYSSSSSSRQTGESNEPHIDNNTHTTRSTPTATATSTINDLSENDVLRTITRTINGGNTNGNSISDNLLNIFTTQLTDTIQQYVTRNDNSYNNLNNQDNGILSIDYIIETPTSMYSATLPLRTTTTQLNTDNDNNDTESDVDDVVGDIDN